MTPPEQLILVGAIILACALSLLLAICRTSKVQPWFHTRCRWCGMLILSPGLCRRCAERRERDEGAAMRIYEAALSEKSKPQGGKLAIGTHHRAASEFRQRRSN